MRQLGFLAGKEPTWQELQAAKEREAAASSQREAASAQREQDLERIKQLRPLPETSSLFPPGMFDDGGSSSNWMRWAGPSQPTKHGSGGGKIALFIGLGVAALAAIIGTIFLVKK